MITYEIIELIMSEEKYKGQLKRIWYQQGQQDALNNLKIENLRQWINEKPVSHLATDEDIKIMLGII